MILYPFLLFCVLSFLLSSVPSWGILAVDALVLVVVLVVVVVVVVVLR